MADQQSVHDPRPPGAESPASHYPDELYDARIHLNRLRVHHFELAKRFLDTADGSLYTIDLMVAAVMNRSYSLVDGFIDAFDRWNLVVAAPVLRMQLDSLTRLAYMASAPEADKVAEYVVGGGEFRKLKDKEGKLLRDIRLVELAKDSHPWIKPVYEATSGWVHLSPAHMSAAWKLDDSEIEGEQAYLSLLGAIPTPPERIPVSSLQEVIGAMIKATEEIFGYAEAWESRKGLPAGEMRDIS
jgi:hypothetical protein